MKRGDIRSNLFSDSPPPIFAPLCRQFGRTDAARHRSIDREFNSVKTKIEYLSMGEVADAHSQAVEQAVLKGKEVLGPC